MKPSVAVIFPIVGAVADTYRYVTWVGAEQSSVTIAFVGGQLIKTFAIPLIKGIVTGALFKRLITWLHAGKDTKVPANTSSTFGASSAKPYTANSNEPISRRRRSLWSYADDGRPGHGPRPYRRRPYAERFTSSDEGESDSWIR